MSVLNHPAPLNGSNDEIEAMSNVKAQMTNQIQISNVKFNDFEI
jgi:hypothetical protein